MTTTEAQSRINALTGIHIDKVDRNRILQALKDAGKEIDPTDSTEQLAVQLHMVYDGLPNERKIRCLKCKGVGDEQQSICPFCGCEDGESVDAKPNGKEGKSKREKGAKVDKANGTAAVVAADDLQPSSEIRTVRELDAAVADIESLKGRSAAAMWQLGRRIADIHQHQLWKLRVEVAEGGKATARFKTWESFVHTELKMSPKTAARAMDVALHYSEQQVALWGTLKLDLLLSAPPEERERIMKEKVEAGAGTREIEQEVKRTKAQAGFKRETRDKSGRGGRRSETQVNKAAAEKKKEGSKQITIANIIGTQTVKLYKRPASLKNVDWKAQPRAKKIADQPIGILELENDVEMLLAVQETSTGELAVKVITQRVE